MSAKVAQNGSHSGGEEARSVYTASSVSEIRASLAELGQREETITSRLDSLLATQKELTNQLSRLDLARAHLGTQVVATRNISHGMLSSASATASRISGAVKKLDREQAAVRATLEVVEQVAELKACVLGVSGSMGAPQDWETAATYLHRASNIPDEVIDGAFAEDNVPTSEVPDAPRQTLNAASESLCALFLREFDKAAKEGDGARVTRFFKLFPLIGKRDMGLDAYGRYVCSGIASRARNSLDTSQRRDGMFYANALTKLFEHIAQIVDGHEALVERHYGAGSMIKVIERVQVEADVQGGIILDTWSEERRVSRRLTDVKSYPFNFLVQSFLPASKTSNSPAPGSRRTSEDEAVDMKEIDALLNESAHMLGRWALYARFLAGKISAPSEGDGEEKLHVPGFLFHSRLQKKIGDLLIEPFNVMATFFFRRSVEKSFQLDEPPSDLTLNPNKAVGSSPPFVTSAVDDVMYIVNQVLQRTLANSQRNVIASVVPALGRVLGSDFFGMMQRKMRDESYPKAAIQGALPPESVIISFILLTNNLDVATSYVHRIVQTCLGTPAPDQPSPLADSFPFGSESVFVEKALRNMEATFTAKTKELITEAVDVLLKQVVRPRLRPVIVDTFRDIDYMPSSNGDTIPNREDDDPDSEDVVSSRFTRGWQAFTLPLKRLLTPALYESLLTVTLGHLARTLERRLWSLHGRISPLGAVRLERDLAGIVSAAVKGGRYELRSEFERCTQICVVMNLEEDEWEEAHTMEWRLDEGERKRARGLVVREG